MDTIQTYIDNLFISLPANEKTRRAKQELTQIMEDKYRELKLAGATENEAVGRVIADFGSLEDLRQQLDLPAQDGPAEDAVSVSLQEGMAFLEVRKKSAALNALGVFLCIISPVALILLTTRTPQDAAPFDAAQFIGLAVLLLLVGAAVVLFIVQGSKLSRYQSYEKSNLRLESALRQQLQTTKAAESAAHTYTIALSVGLMILAVLFPAGAQLIQPQNPMIMSIAVGLLLALVGLAVALLY